MLGRTEMSISTAWLVWFVDGVASGPWACGLPQFPQTLECIQTARGLAKRQVLVQQVSRGPKDLLSLCFQACTWRSEALGNQSDF